jgi:gliding motility-associated-like protein
MKRLLVLIFLWNTIAYSQPQRLAGINLDHFTIREKASAEILRSLKIDFNHPDAGIFPFDGPPCKDCIEQLEKRDANSRYFTEANNKSKFFVERASSSINFLDEKGRWREINHRLTKESEKVFSAKSQPVPLTIDLNRKLLIISDDEFNFPKLENPNSIYSQQIGTGSTENFTAGDDGILIHDYYPGIDLVFIVKEGNVESSFILNNKYIEGDLLLRQTLNTNKSYKISPELSAGSAIQQIFISAGNNLYTVDRGYAFDDNIYSKPQGLNSQVIHDGFEFNVPGKWLSDPDTKYPVIIDPIVWSQNTLPLISIPGTKYSATCWTNSCDYFLSVNTPANATILGIYHSFEFYATGACFAEDGAYSLDFNTCHAPAGLPGVYLNPLHISNAYFTADTVLNNEFANCIPAPACAPQALNFTLHFYRCNNDTSSVCGANCIRATKPWIMYIVGQTVEVTSITGAQSVCTGDSAIIVATSQWGVAPYTYAWSPGTSTIDTLIDFPAATTNYTVTVTDACGITATQTTVVNVTSNSNPGFIINPNPACVNDVINLNGNGAGVATDYDWIVPGSNAAGGIISDNQNPTLSYTIPGTYDVILAYSSGSCAQNDTMQVTINSAAAPDVIINSNPPGSVCAGDTVTFNALPTNGGATPNYEWFIDGVSVQNGPVDSLVTFAFVNGSVIQVVMTSTSSCVSPSTDTTSIFMNVGTGASPVVTITPDTSVCDGSPLTLTASFSNGGPVPFIQWYSNGVLIAGANTASYSFNVISPDTIISVEVTSSLSCVVNPIGTDSSIVSIIQNPVATANLTASPVGTVCSGDSVVYSMSTTNAGSPTFQWFINGVLNANTDSVLTYIPNDNDSISVSMFSGISCASNPQLDSYIIADVSSGASPVVNLNASPSTSICNGDTITFNATVVNGGSAPIYNWTINGVASGTNDSILVATTLADNDVVQIIATSSLTCAIINSDTASVTISVATNNPPTVSIIPLPVGPCEGDSVQLIAEPVNGGATPLYQWNVNGVPNGLTTDTIYLTNLFLDDTVTVDMTSTLSCASGASAQSSPYISTQQPLLTPQINLISNPTDSLCQGQTMLITASVTNGGSSPDITWYVNGIADTSSLPVFGSSSFASGDIVYAELVSNETCLTQPSDTSNIVRVYYFGSLSVQLTTDTLACPGVPIEVTAVPAGGNRGPYDVVWSTGDRDTTVVTVEPTQWMPVYVMIDDNCTAAPAYDTLFVPTLTGPVANFSYANTSPGAFTSSIQFTNLSTNTDTWQWLFTDSNVASTEWNPIHKFPGSGTYDVILFTLNNNGCIDSVLYTVIVNEDIAIYYPNSFTPNGDGINEFFSPIGATLDYYKLTIWDRWGNLVYTGDEAHPWNGINNGDKKPSPDAVYVWRVDFGNDRFGDRIATGRVTLIR